MPDYVVDNLALPGPKVLWDGASSDVAVPDMWCRYTDYNALRDASNSLRTFVKTGLAPGIYSLATLTVGPNGNITGVAAGSGLTDGDKGDVVVSGGGTVFTVDTASITLAKMANASASSFLGNTGGSPAAPAYMTAAQARTLLGLAAIATSGSGADLTANSVTNAKLAQMAANTLKGNNTGGAANAADLTSAQILTMLQIKVGGLGDGSDGAATFDGSTAVTGYTLAGSTYSAQRETAFTDATFSNGVILDQTNASAHAGFALFIAGTATITSGTATIKYNGIAASGQTGGAGLGNNPQGNNSAAGAGSIQNAGQVGANAGNWTNKIKGGVGGNGGASPTAIGANGGTVGNTYTALLGEILTWHQARLARINLSNPGIVSGGAGGASGAGTVGIAGGGAGGGGAGVGVVGIGAVAGAGTLVIEARGGAGSNGIAALGSNAAGGGGGGGGILFIGFGGSTQPGNLTLQCPGGAFGTPQGTGNPGTAGGAGTVRFYPLGAV